MLPLMLLLHAASDSPSRAVMAGEAQAAFDLPLPCASAFPLFTPAGEQRWAAGWQPEMLVGDGLAPAIGDVFETQGHGRRFVWTVADVDPQAFRIVYVRVAEGFQVGRVTVQCRALAESRPAPGPGPGPRPGPRPGAAAGIGMRVGTGADAGADADADAQAASRIEVTYRLVGLGDEGVAYVAAFFAPGAFDRFIGDWPREIQAALARDAR